jgi:hypothetical protein
MAMTDDEGLPEVREGDPLSADWLNRLRALALGRPRLTVDGSTGLYQIGDAIGFNPPPTLRRCRAVEPVPVMSGTEPGSGEIAFYQWDGLARTLSGETDIVLNDGPTAVPVNAEMFVYREFNAWWVLGWWC